MSKSSENERREIPIDPRVKSFYDIAEEFGDVDVQEISPSFSSLKSTMLRYQSPVLIASGGMKQIHQVYDARAKRPLAMAMLHHEASVDLFDPFIHEAWLTAQLDHPNIMTIHDVGVDPQGRPYFTMDLKTGDSLGELIDKLERGDRETLERYPLAARLEIFFKVCDAVAYAHSRGVIHLDLKPANIQIGDYGEVLVCDWGLGRVLSHDDQSELDRQLLNPDLLDSVNLFGERKGTPGYMAPEQLQEGGELDVRTDVYGLGGILYALLTLRQPLTGATEEIVQRTIDGAIIPPSMRVPQREIAKSLDAVVMQALGADPAGRYPTVGALRDEVHRYLTGFATLAENARVFTQLKLFYRRNQRFCLTMFGALAVLLTGTAVAFHLLHEKELAAVQAKHQAERNERIADEMRQQADRTLQLYTAGKGELESMTLRNAKSVASVADRFLIQAKEGPAKSLLQEALAQEPDNPVYLRAMGIWYFVSHRFNQAIGYLERGLHHGDDVCNIAREYAAIKEDDTRLSAAQLIEILRRFTIHEPLELQLVVNDQKQRSDLSERARIIEEYLRTLNPDWTDGWFEYDADANRLRVGGRGLQRLASQRSVLAGLQPRTLDISGSEVSELWQEIGYAIESLDIRGTPIKELWFLKRFVHLKQLIITPGQLSPEQLQILPGRVQVLEKEYPGA